MESSYVDGRKKKESLHIVVFPWLAFGHLLPFLELSKHLAEKGHKVSFISTPRNILRLPKIPQKIAHLISFIPFPLPETDNLPADAEATSDLPSQLVPYLKTAFDSLQQPFSELIHSSSPAVDWIILDFAPHWAPPIAASAGVPFVYFSVYLATSLVYMLGTEELLQSRKTPDDLTMTPPWIPFRSNVVFRPHEARRLFGDCYVSNASGVTDMHRAMSVIKSSRAIATRSSDEWELKWLQLLAHLHNKPVIPVGLLPPVTVTVAVTDEDEDSEAKEILNWLDEQKPGSVVYIAFGSEAELSNEEMQKLGRGLELSSVPFLWAMRRPIAGMFPEGSEEKIQPRGHGLIVNGLLPQLKILAHRSVGGFLNHAGWSSIIESLKFGHPMILLPVFGDQGLIARVVVEKGVAVEVERDEEDGAFSEEAVAKVVRMVMVEEEGKTLRGRANEMRAVVGDEELQGKYVDGFIEYLESNTQTEAKQST